MYTQVLRLAERFITSGEVARKGAIIGVHNLVSPQCRRCVKATTAAVMGTLPAWLDLEVQTTHMILERPLAVESSNTPWVWTDEFGWSVFAVHQ